MDDGWVNGDGPFHFPRLFFFFFFHFFIPFFFVDTQDGFSMLRFGWVFGFLSVP